MIEGLHEAMIEGVHEAMIEDMHEAMIDCLNEAMIEDVLQWKCLTKSLTRPHSNGQNYILWFFFVSKSLAWKFQIQSYWRFGRNSIAELSFSELFHRKQKMVLSRLAVLKQKQNVVKS